MINWIKQNQAKLVKIFIITSFLSLYILVSSISMIHSISFFRLSNTNWLAISLALGFEVGAAASLASLIVLDKMNKFIVWGLFIILTVMQMMGNAYYAYSHLAEYQQWVELFGLIDLTEIEQKRILAIVSGAILPVVALGFIKSLVDYIRPEQENTEVINDDSNKEEKIIIKEVIKENDNIETVKQLLHEQDEIITDFITVNTNKRLFNNVIKQFNNLKNNNKALKDIYNIPSIQLKLDDIVKEELIENTDIPIIESIEEIATDENNNVLKEDAVDNIIEDTQIINTEIEQSTPIIESKTEIKEDEKVVEEIKIEEQPEIKEDITKDENKNHIYGEKAVKLTKEIKDYFDEKTVDKKQKSNTKERGMTPEGGIKVG